ncbi:MAG TPA: helix-turn-helix transcriptional regulator [Terracidiphilus sp.]|nr:helix-turn-helix transcriptional regulator [Terracidiphilus sp.]
MHAYDELIRYSSEYLDATNGSRAATDPAHRAAEIAYLVLRISKGDVRLRLGTLARKLGIASRALGAHFRELYGTTLKDSQIHLRIKWARHLMHIHPERKITSIAAESGYSDVADFNHVFRKYTGMSPRQYRDDCRKAQESNGPDDSF